jgi:dolichol-phosphate mannosyltransferase
MPKTSSSLTTSRQPETSAGRKTSVRRMLVVVATYNEIENLPRLVDDIFDVAPNVEVLVIDDNSPDGTGDWCEGRMVDDQRFHCIHRAGKLGLGTATIEGFQFAIDNGYDTVLTMDADFSHPPRFINSLFEGVNRQDSPVDVTIGSRYVKGGGIEGWPWKRRWMSRWVNRFARLMLGLKARDCSGAFRCYRTEILQQLDFDAIRSRGYSYLEEILWSLKQVGAQFEESPFIFVDRQHGQTKINTREAVTALWIIFRLGIKNWFRV